MPETLMHADFCHYFLWAYRQDDGRGLVVVNERGYRPNPHARGKCKRCTELKRGATPMLEARQVFDIPEDSDALLLTVLTLGTELAEGIPND